jgi:hypothetical protein
MFRSDIAVADERRPIPKMPSMAVCSFHEISGRKGQDMRDTHEESRRNQNVGRRVSL